MRRLALAAAAVPVIAVAAVAVPTSSAAPDTTATAAATTKKAKVSVRDDFFSPKTIKVRKGGSVTWTWRGDSGHDVVGKGGLKSTIKSTGTYKKTFKKTGSYSYVCTIHEGMTGTVRVVSK